MSKKIQSKFYFSLAMTFVVAGLIFFSTPSRMYRILELKSFDLRFSLKGEHPGTAPVVHIDIDDQSLEAVGRWPWPRRYHGLLTEILSECGARMIVWDVIFTEEFKDNPEEDLLFARAIERSGSTYLPFYFSEERQKLSLELRQLLTKDMSVTPETAAKTLNVAVESLRERLPEAKKFLLDETVREFMRDNPGISFEGIVEKMEGDFGWFLFAEDEGYVESVFSHHDLARSFMQAYRLKLADNAWPFRKKYQDINPPIRQYLGGLRGSGFINAEPDLDGVTRRVALLVKYGQTVLPQLSFASLMDFLKVKEVKTSSRAVILKGALKDGKREDIVIPVDPAGSMLLNWPGRWEGSFKHIPYYLILDLIKMREDIKALENSSETSITAVSLEYLKKSEHELLERMKKMVSGKICIVGLTATGTHDLRPVPLQENYPMVGVHSSLYETILNKNFIVRKDGWVRVFLLMLSAVAIAAGSLLKMRNSLLVSLGFIAGYFVFSCFVFQRFGLWIDMVGPLSTAVIGFASMTSYRFFTEEREKLWIRQAFGHYVSKEVIGELMDDPAKLKLGGERKLITVLFSDVRGFTSFSESHQPEEVVAMLNEILSEQVKVIFSHSGTLDKFVGDEVMAFFGAPGTLHRDDHALVAVRTAVEIQEKMRELRLRWTAAQKENLSIGIGINTGEMVVGNIGSADRMDYTVIGDNVNLGARLCSAASKDEIIVSESTYVMVADQVRAEKLEPIALKGKAKPVPIYRILGLK